MRESDHAFAVGRVWVLETFLIDHGKFERMLEAQDAEEVFRILGETEYAGALAAMRNPTDYEAAFHVERRRVFGLVRTLLASSREVGDLFFLRFDAHNLKVMLKSQMTGQPVDGLVDEGVYGAEMLRRILEGEEKPTEPIGRWVEDSRAAMVSGDPQEVDVALDSAYFSYAAQRARENDWKSLTRYWLASVDLTNLITLVRCRLLGTDADFLSHILLRGGDLSPEDFAARFGQPDEAIVRWVETHGYSDFMKPAQNRLDSIAALERARSEYLHGLLMRAGRQVVIGPEPVFAYLLAKEIEMQKIRIIAVGKLNGIPREVLRERLLHAHL